MPSGLEGLDPKSNRRLVREKIATYLERGKAQGSILYAGSIFPHPPKLTQQTDLFAAGTPGQAGGAVIYMYISNQGEYRLALGGRPVPNQIGSGGRKGRVYSLSLLCYLLWKGPKAEEADAANDAFIDSLTSWIEIDRNAGTQDPSLGGDGSGVIFSWGEGADPSAIPGGKDIVVHTSFPKQVRGQATQVFNIVDVAVIATLGT